MKKWTKYLPLLLVAILLLFFTLLYKIDNKYQMPPPYGRNGVISLTEADLRHNRPLFLIDGWLLTDRRVTKLPTYIGEFANLQRGDWHVRPHGISTYELTLRYRGSPIEAAINFSQLFNWHIITLDQKVLSQGNGGAKLSFTLTPGDHVLSVTTVSNQGYYSGMYHPPALGTSETIFRMASISCIAYGMAFFISFALAVFTLVLWRSAEDAAAFWFGLLCCCYSLYVSYYFVRLLSLPFEAYWYLVQSAALYGLCYCVMRLTILSCGLTTDQTARHTQLICLISSALLLILAIFIPVISWAVWLHGLLTNGYFTFNFCGVLLMTLRSRSGPGREQKLTQLACVAFGVGLLHNLFAANLLEPIYFFWQFEWCGLLLVALFGSMMAARNKRILEENNMFRIHLEDMVAKRTEELSNLLKERKIFFADMAHDLKAPIFATGSFIQAIRENNTGIDGELARYLDLVEQKQQEMARRVQGLTLFNKMDELSEPYEAISVRELLTKTYETHHMAAEVQSVHLVIELPDIDGKLYTPPGKLSILLENLLFNALRATPANGSITLSAGLDEDGCHLSIADTGRGIPQEDMPHIFERFFVGQKNKETSSGLGLYIVKNIVKTLNGEISVSSKPEQGCVFFIDLPLMKEV